MAKGGTIEFTVKVNGYWQRCPVCDGRGFVPVGFYGPQSGLGSPACRRCDGSGTITVPLREGHES